MSVETTTRSRMLRTAAQLLQRQGFHATGLRQILTASGAPRGSLYFHFPGGKEQLAVEALTDDRARISRAIERTLSAHRNPDDAIRAFAHSFAEILRHSNYAEGCPVATVTLEAAATSEPIRAACAASYTEWHGLIRECLARAGFETERVDALATLVLAAVEGGLILSRAQRDTAPLSTIAEQLAALLQASKQPRRAGRRRSRTRHARP
jgi:TetR/AcrR family transcriptional repressor of lmrAB and yxaGH operons